MAAITRVPEPPLFSPRLPPVSLITPLNVAVAPLATLICAGAALRMMPLSMVAVWVMVSIALVPSVTAPPPRLPSARILTVPPAKDEVPA